MFGDNEPSLMRKDELHYTNAVLLEGLRLSALVPFAIPHKVVKEVKCGEYILPKGTVIFPSLISIMRDPRYFKDAKKFKPERFLNKEGIFERGERVIPFSIGKRYCLGQSLAEKEYFLFFAMIMKKFDMNPVPLEQLPSYDLEDRMPNGLIRTAPNFNIMLTRRG